MTVYTPLPSPAKNTKSSFSERNLLKPLWLEMRRKDYCVKNFHLKRNADEGIPPLQKAEGGFLPFSGEEDLECPGAFNFGLGVCVLC